MILLFYLLYYFSGVAGNDYIIRDVVRHDTSGSYYYAVADSHTRTDDDASSEPAVITNMYWQTYFYGLTASHADD